MPLSQLYSQNKSQHMDAEERAGSPSRLWLGKEEMYKVTGVEESCVNYIPD